MNKLKECPFCGNSAEIIEVDSPVSKFDVYYKSRCTCCGVIIDIAYPTEKEAINKWNKRYNE